MSKFNHVNDFGLLAYTLIEKDHGLQYHLSGVDDYDTLTIDTLADHELLYSINEEYPYEVSELYAFTDYDYKRKNIKLFKTASAAITNLININHPDSKKIKMSRPDPLVVWGLGG